MDRWLRSGELQATRVNDQYRLNRIDLLEFASAHGLEISPELLAELEHPQLPSLADALRAGGVHRDVSGGDKASILRAVVDRLPLPPQVDREQLHRVLLAREALGSTGLGNGIAIPHPRNPIVLRVPGPEVAVCYLDRAVDFEAVDGKPVHTLITLVTPSTRAHLHLLAVVAAAGRLVDRSGERNDFSDGFLTFDGHAFQRDVGRPVGELPEVHPGEERLFACGGLMSVRREAFLGSGGFDDDYFAQPVEFSVLPTDPPIGYIQIASFFDDQVETVLMRILEGSGISGLKGIPRRTDDGLERPLHRLHELDRLAALLAPPLALHPPDKNLPGKNF